MEMRTPRRAPRGAQWRDEIGGLAERIARLETTAEHLQETLMRIDGNVASLQQKLEALTRTIAEGTGGLRVGGLLAQAAAAVAGFAAAHLWPGGK